MADLMTEQIILDIGSIGFGVQSTGMLWLAAKGEIPKADKYVFSDLHREGQAVYDYIHYITPILKSEGIEVERLDAGDIYEEILSWPTADRISMIPVWFRNADGKPQPLNRQCTMDFKIEVIAKSIRSHLGVKRLKRHSIRVWQGISIDEIDRVKKRTKLFPDDRSSYRVNHYPFIAQYANITYPGIKWKSLSREQIVETFLKDGLKVPPKSSCFFCPFHTIIYWHFIYTKYPLEWELACKLDDSIRNYNTKYGSLESGPFYLYRGLVPLREIDFDIELLKQNKNLLFQSGCETGFCHS